MERDVRLMNHKTKYCKPENAPQIGLILQYNSNQNLNRDFHEILQDKSKVDMEKQRAKK